jgi:membrane protein YdbS with pleckstrin-like domain
MPPENQPINISQPPADSQSRQSVHGLLPSEMRLLNHDERIITIVHRSIVGLIFIYLEAFGAVAALLALAILAFPDLFSSLSENSNMLLTAGIVLAMTLVFFILFLATYIYRQSKLIVTDQNLIQILQGGLFSRKISRLSVSNVEDVTAEQHGFLPTIFNYGTLIVETAGEMKNFIFPYCPNPNTYADQILDARQAYADRLSDDN